MTGMLVDAAKVHIRLIRRDALNRLVVMQGDQGVK